MRLNLSHTIRKFRLILVTAGAVVLAISLWWHLYAGTGPTEIYATTPVVRGNIENSVAAVGILQPLSFVDVGAQVSGQLKTLKVKEGNTVKKGDLIAEIDPTVYAAKLLEAQANLENLKAQLKVKQAQLVLNTQKHNRYTTLIKLDSVAEADAEAAFAALETSRAEIEAIQAQIKQAEGALETAKANLGYTKITAPMDGTVVSITARQGQTLNANQQAPIIMRIADIDTMTVWAQVSEADVPRLKPGQEAYFSTLGQPNKRWTGNLRLILPAPEIINNVTFYDALFDVPNPGSQLKVQMTAQTFFVLERAQDALIIPASALENFSSTRGTGAGRKSGAGQKQKDNPASKTIREQPATVQVLKDDGSVESRQISVGVSTAVLAQVLSGLQEGERVVTGIANQTAIQQKAAGLGGGKRPNKL